MVSHAAGPAVRLMPRRWKELCCWVSCSTMMPESGKRYQDWGCGQWYRWTASTRMYRKVTVPRWEEPTMWIPIHRKLGLIWSGRDFDSQLVGLFICLRQMFFPVFKVGNNTVSSPYYKIPWNERCGSWYGTNTEKKQNLFSLILRVRCCMRFMYSDGRMVMTLSTKGLRIKGNPVYVVSPYASCLSKFTPYDVTNTAEGSEDAIVLPRL